jgi:hypothetical protein
MDGQREGEEDAHICGARIADTHTFQRRMNRQDRTAFFTFFFSSSTLIDRGYLQSTHV